MDNEQQHKPHRKSKEKKKPEAGSKNPKAFGFSRPRRHLKQQARDQDIKEKRYHVPLVDRLPEEAPPLVVGVVGPPGVGKSTLIKSLIRRYTKQTVGNPSGPLTVVTSKRRRLTFIECPADSLASMIDIAKVVDIVLLMIDGHYGFEMETMEFLNVLSSSGMPGNVFGILTHLDLFKKQDTLRTRKKQLKHRFWSELYQGAKLFYLSGVVNGRYPDREVLNLSRFLSVMKNPRPLIWRNSHPYCLADRYLDVTSPTEIEQNPKCDRTIALYGYVRGTNFPAQGTKVHIPGVGDIDVSKIEALPDPCPTPHLEQAIAKATGKAVRKRLGEKQKVLYAPMSDVGGVLIDKDAVYIDIKQPTFDANGAQIEDKGFGEQLMLGLQGDRRLLGEADDGVKLFGNDKAVRPNIGDDDHLETQRRPANLANGDIFEDHHASVPDDEAYVSGDEHSEDVDEPSLATDDEGSELDSSPNNAEESDEEDERLEFADSDSDVPSVFGDATTREDNSGALRWKTNLTERAKELHSRKTPRRTADLARLMYNLELAPSQAVQQWNGREKGADQEQDEDDFFKPKTDKDDEDIDDALVPTFDYDNLERKWQDPNNLQALKSKFTYARLQDGEDAGSGMDAEADEIDPSEEDNSDEGDGDFEDLEAEPDEGERTEEEISTLETEREKNAQKKEELKARFEEEDREGFANDKANERRHMGTGANAEFGEDDWYDAQKAKLQKQLDINRAEFDQMDEDARVRVEGYSAGMYVRIVLERVPYEFSAHFNPRYPIIIGGLSPTETRFGFVQVRIKRHRWHQRILKNNDPLIFSLGWRRFQTIPIYSISDSRTRNRMLKYTPEHMHCFGTFYGPLVAPNTGFCCVQSFSNKTPGFRIAATGVVLNVDESTEIVKKLKLKGYPHKIFKNTAIIRDMFASELEVMKFKAGNVRTVSGVRGMIKGRAGNQYPDGYVRAGFEDKILKSDIVFLSTWRLVQPRQFYLTVTNLLMPATSNNGVEHAGETSDGWQGMRLTGEVRYERGLAVPQDKNSFYRPTERPERHFNPLRVPRKLAADLPFKSQIAQMKPQKRDTYMKRRTVVVGGEEKKARDLMQKLTTLRNEKTEKRRAKEQERKAPHKRKMAENEEKKKEREKREKEEYWRREGKKRKNQEQTGGGSKKKRKS
ncbi:MAG: Glycoside hydrolase 2 (Mannanase, beta-galactosidase) [Alyxoria varia]|nr:MAG: Glycoside hydrolase 2 (Mannanase, beta-galactosidase) [Alyxoria varia]